VILPIRNPMISQNTQFAVVHAAFGYCVATVQFPSAVTTITAGPEFNGTVQGQVAVRGELYGAAVQRGAGGVKFGRKCVMHTIRADPGFEPELSGTGTTSSSPVRTKVESKNFDIGWACRNRVAIGTSKEPVA
jgi:hypothetical protein